MFALGVAPGIGVAAAVDLLATRFTNTISAGVIILSLVAGLATVVGIIYGVKWKIAYEVECKAREGAVALNDQLEDRIRTFSHERTELIAKLGEATQAINDRDKTIARLEALPNLERVLELVTDTFTKLGEKLEALHHEGQAAADRRTQQVLAEIKRAA